MSRQDFFRLMRARIRNTPGTRIDPAEVDNAGSTVNLLTNAVSAVAEELDERDQARIAANLSSTARDTDLDTLVTEQTFSRLLRKGASASVASLFFVRTTTALAGTVPAGSAIRSGGLTFTLDRDASFLAGQSWVSGAVSFTCKAMGSASNVELTGLAFVSPTALFDQTIVPATSFFGTPPNGDYATGGADRETDSEFRSRRATWDSGQDVDIDRLAAVALGVGGITYAVAIEDLTLDGTPIGSVSLYVGDVNGRANAALLARVRAAIRSGRMVGQNVKIVGSSPSLQTIVLSFGVLSTYDTTSVQAAVVAAVVAAVNALGPGQTLSRALIAAAVASVPGTSLLSAAPYGCTVPATDVVAATPSTIFRTSAALVSFA